VPDRHRPQHPLLQVHGLAGFGVGHLPDFMLALNEAASLVHAAVPHDPECALFLVISPR
jgi:hypothetical protein